MPLTAASPTTDLLSEDLISVLNRHHFQPQEEWRKTSKSKKLPPLPLNTYYIGRGTPLGNPYDVKDIIEQEDLTGDEARAIAVQRYRTRLWREVISTQAGPAWEMLLRLARIVRAGQQINLLCSCAPKKCHGDVVKAAIAYLIENWMPEWGELDDVSCIELETPQRPAEQSPEEQPLGQPRQEEINVEALLLAQQQKPKQEEDPRFIPATSAFMKVGTLVKHSSPSVSYSIGKVIGFLDAEKTVCIVLWQELQHDSLIVKHPTKNLHYYCIPQGTPRTYPTRLLKVMREESE